MARVMCYGLRSGNRAIESGHYVSLRVVAVRVWVSAGVRVRWVFFTNGVNTNWTSTRGELELKLRSYSREYMAIH